ncbi:DUF1566 domain-containing protein [Legionella sp. km772]|uniref:DUF1566 domain-containing protein n=1 Tax=Legionella sp. km772 TaxID=2498111 RepID=UPI000F8DFFCC|nr:DUF1566 domain-containing protein [Legionella sp. km772]RUR12709.1 DUF1566 domain-containing protein [Legionella sp. km772]
MDHRYLKKSIIAGIVAAGTIGFAQANTTLAVLPTAIIPVNNGSGLITVTNTGTSETATNVHALIPGQWSDVVQDSSNCAAIAPNGGTCTLTFTSNKPYVAEENIIITGDNINSPPSVAIAFTASNYLIWAVNSTTEVSVIDTYDLTTSQWGEFGGANAQSLTNGAQNTTNAVTTHGIGNSAALICYNNTSGNAALGSWYLPAICELGTAGLNPHCDPDFPNIYANLIQHGFEVLDGFYWSSSEYRFNPTYSAWVQFVKRDHTSAPFNNNKLVPYKVRCVRKLSL